MELPSRKSMRLNGYDYAQAGCYFITICTAGKAHSLGAVVGDDVLIGPHVRLSELGRLAERQIGQMGCVDKAVIMPNHVHLLLKLQSCGDGSMGTSTPTQSVSQLVHFFKASVTKRWGAPVWQRSFYDHIIRSEADYLRIWSYMDENPARWREDCYYKEGTLC